MHKWVVVTFVALLCLAISLENRGEPSMLERINPASLHPPVGQSLIVVSNYRRTAYFTANPLDAEGNVVGENFEEQNEQVFKNVALALEELGVDYRHIIQMTGYIVNYDPAYHGPLIAKGLAGNPPDYEYSATMLMGVESLARPEVLFEVGLIIGLD